MASEYEEDVESLATRVVYELLGRRWVWPAITTTEYHETYSGQRVISLLGRPVVTVTHVRVEDTTDDLPFSLESGYRIRLESPLGYRSGLCSGPPRLEVRYSYGAEPPVAVLRAIEVYSSELTKAMTGDSTCRLPQRVTSITRQGISMTLLDPGEYLDEGKTGLPEVDSMLRVFNPSGARRPARVFGKATPPPTRVDTTQA